MGILAKLIEGKTHDELKNIVKNEKWPNEPRTCYTAGESHKTGMDEYEGVLFLRQ